MEQRKRDSAALARVGRRLGISLASFYPGYLAKDRPWDDVLKDSVQSMREMRAAAGGEGLNLAVELHARTPFETIEQGQKLLAALPDLPVAYDPSHYAMQGLDVRQTQMFIDRAAHVHLRDAGPVNMQMPTGKGTVDFAWILEALRRRNYQGPITIEYLPDLEGGVETSIRDLKNWLEPRIRDWPAK